MYHEIYEKQKEPRTWFFLMDPEAILSIYFNFSRGNSSASCGLAFPFESADSLVFTRVVDDACFHGATKKLFLEFRLRVI